MNRRLYCLLFLILLAALPFVACASAEEVSEGTAVLMNIPYDVFYTSEGVSGTGLDAVSSATKNKPRTMGLAGGSYHVNADGSDISGVIYPVYVQSMADLKALGGRQITDESSVEITVTNRGQTTTTTYTGREALFEAPSYSYYILPADEAPVVYKTLTASGFTAIKGRDKAVTDASASVSYSDSHCDIVINVTGFETEENISAAELITSENETYGLRHVAGIWRKTSLGLNRADAVGKALLGKTIMGIRFITTSGKYMVSTNLSVGENVAVLMNIPYDVFYTSEGVSGTGLDAVSSATKNKPRTMGLAGGSYHVNADGSDISGVIYPVYVQSMSDLKALGGRQITDESSVEITVNNLSKKTTTTYTGREALFEAPSYSYYILPADEAPVVYKTLTASGFTAIKGRDKSVDATAAFKRDLRHCDIAIAITGLTLDDSEYVTGVELIAEDGTTYGLKHVENIWRKTELGLNFDSDLCKALADGKIVKIRYITQKGKYAFNVDLPLIVHFNALENVLKLPVGTVSIEDGAFVGIAAKAIDIPASANEQSIGSAAFAGIPQPYYVRIPSSVIEIAEDAFDDGNIIMFCEKDSAAYNYLSGKRNIIWRKDIAE